jgi:hypothetical protein
MKNKLDSIKFHIKEALEMHGIIVHRNINEPTALFLGENGDTVVVGVITLLFPISTNWNEEAISEHMKKFFDDRGEKNFSFHSIDSFKRCEEKGVQPVERLKIRFASW